jgi:hypothetical protein
MTKTLLQKNCQVLSEQRLFCAPARVAWSMINGRVVEEEGRPVTVDTAVLARRQRTPAAKLMRL